MKKVSLKDIEFKKEDEFAKKSAMIFGPNNTIFRADKIHNSDYADCIYLKLGINETIQGHTHDVEEFVYVITGELVIQEGEESISISEKELAYLEPNKKHSFIASTNCDLLVFHSPPMKNRKK